MATYPPLPSYPGHPSVDPTSSPHRRLKPYLGPRAHLSLSWLSQHFLALILVLVALSFLLAQIPTLVDDAKSSLTAACAGVEGAASVAVSLPHYMAGGINELNAKTVNALSEGAATVLDLMLQALEAIVLFMIDMYRSLFLCLLDLAVHGSITVLVKGIEEAQEFVTDALGGIHTAIQESASGVNTLLDKTVGLIDDIPGVDIDVPTIDMPELSALENVTLPDTLINALTDLNSSIPTLDEFRSGLDSLISTPIEALRAQINSTLSNSSIDVELLPVPARQTVELCHDLDTAWVDDVGDGLAKSVKIAIGLVVLAMALFIAVNALWERYRYRAFLGGVAAAREAWLLDLVGAAAAADPKALTASTAHDALSTTNLLSFLNASAHPTLFRLVSRLAALLRLETPSSRANLVWFLSYVAHPYAWAFLALGVVGLVVVQVQIAVLDGPVRRMTKDRANQGAGEFSSSVTGTLNEKMELSAAEWAQSTNRAVLGVEDGINTNLFGWVNDTTTTLNSTMVGFYTEITDAITDVFNGTILEDPALGLVYCLVGSKVDAVSTALTWLHAHAHLSLPTVSPSLLTLSQNQTDELTASLTNPESAVSAPSIADKMISAYRRSLEQQRMGFLVAIGIWLLVLVMGLVGVWWRAAGERAWRRWRGVRGADEGGDDEVEKVGALGADEEKRAFFKPLHLRSASAHARGRAEPAQAFAAPPPMSTHPYGASHSRDGENPSAASWASLIDYFKPTPPDEPRALVAVAHAAEPAQPRRSPRTLVLPSLPSLPSLRRTPATPSSPSTSRPRLRPFIISRPSRPLSAFRSMRDSHFASKRSAPPAGGPTSRRASDCAPLRGGEAQGERRYVLPVEVGAEEGASRSARWRSKVAARMGGRGRARAAEGDDAADEGWEEVHDDDEDGYDEPAGRGVLPLFPSPPPPPPPQVRAPPADPFADPLGASRTLYAPSSRPPVVPQHVRAAQNPFATPFDGEEER
ncbi:hypothetical protein JCM9279_001748 [Rhodotorula babjevae]